MGLKIGEGVEREGRRGDQDLDVTMANGRVEAVKGKNGLTHIREDVEDLSLCEIVLESLIKDAVQTPSYVLGRSRLLMDCLKEKKLIVRTKRDCKKEMKEGGCVERSRMKMKHLSPSLFDPSRELEFGGSFLHERLKRKKEKRWDSFSSFEGERHRLLLEATRGERG